MLRPYLRIGSRRVNRRILLGMFVLLAVYSAVRATDAGNLRSSQTASPPTQQASSTALANATLIDLATAIPASLEQSNPQKTQLTPIEKIQVGNRVLAESPTGDEDITFGSEITPSQWRKLTLRAPKRDGTTAEVVLLRPLAWLNEQHGKVGGTVFISVPECGIDGNAQVLAIDPCPEIPSGGGRVVTGTFLHQARSTITLTIASQSEPIECTGNHPFWSEDRQTFVRADALKPNETLRTANGLTTVESWTHNLTSVPVYNIEVHGAHVYHVGTSGIVVHNPNGQLCSDPDRFFDPLLKNIVTDATKLPWGQVGARKAAIAIQNGAASVTVKTREEAAEVVWRMFKSRGYKDTTGLTPSHVKDILGSKKMTIHWDDIVDQSGRVAGHGIGNIHGALPHVQIHDELGNIIRIFFGG